MCGVLGIFSQNSVSRELVHGLTTIQHRGQDSAGVVTFGDTFHVRKRLGLVSQIFQERHVARLQGCMGLGHVRYPTQGSGSVDNAQPFFITYPFGLAIVHNGNVTNFDEIRTWLKQDQHRLVDTQNDVALILYTFACELEKRALGSVSIEDFFAVVSAVQNRVKGAYSVVMMIAGHGMLAFKDPNGIRPLVFARRVSSLGIDFAFASETTAFDYLGFETVRDVEPGEAVFVDMNRQVHTRSCVTERPAACIFEQVYFAREDSVFRGRVVASDRVLMGRAMARTMRERGLIPDVVIDVPNSAYFAASGLAEELGVPYRRGLAKNPHVGRSFIAPTDTMRETMVRQKLNPIPEVVRGKCVAVVDDSIVRGTTSRNIVRLLRDAGAARVIFVSAAPPVRHPCIYGVDMSVKKEILAAQLADEQDIAQAIGADALVYQTIDDLQEIFSDYPACYACFSGQYPTNVSDAEFASVCRDKISSGRGC